MKGMITAVLDRKVQLISAATTDANILLKGNNIGLSLSSVYYSTGVTFKGFLMKAQ